jgi:hypothetical protein
MNLRFLSIFFALVAVACFSASEGQDPVDQQGVAQPPLPWEVAAREGFRNLGARSCSSTTCHGSVRADSTNDNRMRRDEYLVWLEEDPHQRAHAVLSGERSESIFRNLGLSPDDQQYRQVMQKCIACHGMPVDLSSTDSSGKQLVYEGVSCETCHGPAEKWLKTHYRTDFISLTAEEKSRQGLFNTNNAHQRARLCVACHVGDEQREVNHDWIAAGHPALKFELTAYLSMMPGHWKETRDRKNARNPADHELELWLAGQQAAADASLAQLARRATAAAEGQAGAVWPEFADIDCYSCHHDLAPLSWRQKRGFGVEEQHTQIQRITLPASEWYLFMPSRLAASSKDAAAVEFERAWQELRGKMAAEVIPDDQEIAGLADSTRQLLNNWFSRRSSTADRQQMIDMIGRSDDPKLVSNWDRAVQIYLALRVISEDRGKDKALKQIRAMLAFPVSANRQFDSPKKFRSVIEDVPKLILEFQEQLKGKQEN